MSVFFQLPNSGRLLAGEPDVFSLAGDHATPRIK
jgi:hypothetical protein